MPESSIQVQYSTRLSLSCTAQGLPLPVITWLQQLSNGSQIQYFSNNVTNSQIVITETASGSDSLMSTFVVNSASINSAGIYKCQGQNMIGVAQSSNSVVGILGKQQISLISTINYS